jgi:hypothetical protein
MPQRSPPETGGGRAVSSPEGCVQGFGSDRACRTRRNWRWHKKFQVWLTKDDMLNPQQLGPGHERGYYIVWDTANWRKDRVSHHFLCSAAKCPPDFDSPMARDHHMLTRVRSKSSYCIMPTLTRILVGKDINKVWRVWLEACGWRVAASGIDENSVPCMIWTIPGRRVSSCNPYGFWGEILLR